MSSVSTSSYGIQQQTVLPPPQGSNGSIYSNGKAISANNAKMQNDTNKIGGKKGGAATIPVAVVPVTYRETGAGANTTSANVVNSNKAQADLYANKQYDGCVGSTDSACGQSAGRRLKRRGGSRLVPSWGCMSGGKRRTCRRTCGKRRGKTCRKKRGKPCHKRTCKTCRRVRKSK
jgi:hypothetical protein